MRDIDLNRNLKKLFVKYEQEKHVELKGGQLSEFYRKQIAAEERRVFDLQQRDLATNERKDKRLVHTRNGGRAGVFKVRDKGGVEEKLRTAFGGKVAQRILKAERQAERNDPTQLRVFVWHQGIGDDGVEEVTREQLVRGVDFAVVPKPHGEPTLVLHDRAKQFEVVYSDDYPHALNGDTP